MSSIAAAHTEHVRLTRDCRGFPLSGTDYDVEGFVADPEFRPFDWVTREVVGDVSGKRLLRLQCHIGIDTLRFALADAVDVTGDDFSPRAVSACPFQDVRTRRRFGVRQQGRTPEG